MRLVSVISMILLSSLCYVSYAYAGTLDEVFLMFMYGTIGLLIMFLGACVLFIVNRFNSNVHDIFALIAELQKDVSSIKANCAGNHGNSVTSNRDSR